MMGGVTTQRSDASSLMSLLTRLILSSEGRNPFGSSSFRGMYNRTSLSSSQRKSFGTTALSV
jgi:hypothetical protein